MSDVTSPWGAMRRSLMPVRSVIHASEVSHHLLEVGVGEDLLRRVGPGAEDGSSDHGHGAGHHDASWRGMSSGSNAGRTQRLNRVSMGSTEEARLT